MAARSKATRKKTTSKKATGGTTRARKKTATKAAGAPRAAPKAATPAPGAATPARRISPAEALAKKLLRITNELQNADLSEIYAQECSSIEPGAGPAAHVQGLPALEEKIQNWLSMVESEHWSARNVLVKGNTICIEWQAELKMRDGRVLTLDEVAVHEVRGGKIVAERFYYDPSVLAPPAPEIAIPEPEPEPEPPAIEIVVPEPVHHPPRPPVEEPEDEGPESPIDPIDL